MKFMFLVLMVLPAVSLAGQRFASEQLDWAFLGSAVVDNQVKPVKCVTGDEVVSAIAKPEIVYRLRSVKEHYDHGKFSVLIAEMVITDTTKTLSNVGINKDAYVSMQGCGESFLSTLYYGARIAYTLNLETSEASQIPTIEMVETDSSRATEFFNQVKALTASLKTVSGRGVEMVGGLQIPDRPMNETFDIYKAKALSDKSLRRMMSAESSNYPASIRKAFKD